MFIFPGVVKLCHVRDVFKRGGGDVTARAVAAACAAWLMVAVGSAVLLNTLLQAAMPTTTTPAGHTPMALIVYPTLKY